VAERDTTPAWTRPGHSGAASSGVVLAEATIATAWNLQGDAEHVAFADAVRRQFEVALPIAPNTIAKTDALRALWLGPRSWLLVTGAALRLADFGAKRDVMNVAGGALFDVSASRIAWTISGPGAATVLAKGSPLDFHPRVFAAGTCAQSTLGHVNALFVKSSDAPEFIVMVARSFAPDAWHWLMEAAAQYGVEVQPPAAVSAS
jgi:sarcosine oxidase subunit gamma